MDVSGFLLKGNNRLCVQVNHQGTGSAQYCPGPPFLVYALVSESFSIVSGPECLCRGSKDYVSGSQVQLVSYQLSFSFEYDASKDDLWRLPGYTSSSEWKNPYVYPDLAGKISFYERPVKKLEICPPVPASIIAGGVFIRHENEELTLGQKMQSDFLSPRALEDIFDFSGDLKRSSNGFPDLPQKLTIKENNPDVYILIDLGREEAGLFTLHLDSVESLLIETAYGEHLDDLRVRSRIGSRNFSFSYICCEGEQEFTHYFKRIAGRYLELHIHGIVKPLTLYYAGIRPVEYPLEETGVFHSSDRLFNKINETAKRTLRLCMHEHYEDCPWREQGLYAFDSRNQMLAGYYLFGNWDYARANLTLLAEHPMPNGLIAITAPSDTPFTIPYFSLAWITALKEYALYSGDLDYTRPLYIRARSIIKALEKYLENGLLRTPQGAEFWNFYEWAPGLDAGDGCGKEQPHYAQYDAPLNATFCLALNDLSMLARWLDKQQDAEDLLESAKKITTTFDKLFWNPEKKAYASFIDGGRQKHYAELTQALAVCAGIAQGEKQKLILDQLSKTDSGLVPATLSSLIFKYEALLKNKEQYGLWVFNDIAEKWGSMLYRGATSFWETLAGSGDFDGAGSLCHGWTAIPSYFFFAYALGIKPLKPGFTEYAIDPVKLDIKTAGSILTKAGNSITA